MKMDPEMTDKDWELTDFDFQCLQRQGVKPDELATESTRQRYAAYLAAHPTPTPAE